MKKKLFLIALALVVIGAATAGALYDLFPVRVSLSAAMARNYILSWSAPRGTATTELNPAYKGPALALTPASEAPSDSAGDWPSYNRTLASERYSQLSQINTRTIERLKVSCTYDTGQFAAFASGLIMVEDTLIGTTEFSSRRKGHLGRLPSPRCPSAASEAFGKRRTACCLSAGGQLNL
jgi:alcohol dehydrogenase (cytochrome c)